MKKMNIDGSNKVGDNNDKNENEKGMKMNVFKETFKCF